MRLFDGQHHSVDSSEMAFKIAGSMAFKQAVADADPYLLEPIVQMTIAVPEDAVGDVVGDLNSRRGRPLGMEPKGSVTEIKAEVPMAEVLDYAPDLRAITGGRGDYTMEFERYEEVPGAHRPEGDRRGPGRDEEQVKAAAASRRPLPLRVATLDVPAHDPFPACDVCGRTILKGEQVHEYVTPQRQRIGVCVLCRSRAEASGWIPAEQWRTPSPRTRPGAPAGRALRERLRARPLGHEPAAGGAARPRRSESAEQREPVRDDFDAAMGQPDHEAGRRPRRREPEPVAEPDAAPSEPRRRSRSRRPRRRPRRSPPRSRSAASPQARQAAGRSGRPGPEPRRRRPAQPARRPRARPSAAPRRSCAARSSASTPARSPARSPG